MTAFRDGIEAAGECLHQLVDELGEEMMSEPPLNHSAEIAILRITIERVLALPEPAPAESASGWRMVPVEPTPEMLDEGHDAAVDEVSLEEGLETSTGKTALCVTVNADIARIVYDAMLAAAPTAPDVRAIKVEALREAAEVIEGRDGIYSGYAAADWLRARADEMERPDAG